MTLPEIVHAIQSLQPTPSAFIQQGRGFVDWDFSQVCAYIGFEAAERYALNMRRWYDYQRRYKGCNLDVTYSEYQQAIQLIKNELQ